LRKFRREFREEGRALLEVLRASRLEEGGPIEGQWGAWREGERREGSREGEGMEERRKEGEGMAGDQKEEGQREAGREAYQVGPGREDQEGAVRGGRREEVLWEAVIGVKRREGHSVDLKEDPKAEVRVG
jgi:hypothetical protein